MNKRLSIVILLGLLVSCQGELKVDADQEVDTTVHVTGITLDQKQVKLKEGATVTLVPTVYPEDATNKKVSWSSGDSSVATVEDGKVTAIKAGTTAIIAATEDGGKTAMCSVIVESNLAPAVTVGAEHISAVSVTLKGKANLGSTMSSDLKVGFQYSKSEGILPANSTTVDATEADSDYNYWAVVTGLEPGTTYYFRSFVRQNGMDTYGETKSFSAKELGSMLETLEATDVEAAQAKLNARLDLTDVGYKTLEYGFYWGTSEDSQKSLVKGGEITDAAYSVFMTGLSHKTQYWYKAYIKVDSQSFEGDVKSFTTDVVPVESITLGESGYTFNAIGSTRTFQVVILPSDATNKAIEWTSDNENVATVSASGTVRSVGNGSATITATTVDQKKTASCRITVNQLVTGITLNKTSLTLNEGESQILTATVSPKNANDSKIVWSSSDESVATVDEYGTVTAVSKGSARIRAEANDGSGRYATCSVTVKRLVSGITLDKTSLIMYRGSTDVSENLTATVMPVDANDKTVRWSSSNTSVATVSSSGVVTGKSVGLATITVSARDGSGVEAKCEVEVRQYITSISLDKTSITLSEGQEQTLSATILPSNAYDKSLMWTSSDESVATVDGNGRVTAKSKGSATIKAEAKDESGKNASCSVTITRPVSSIQLSKTSMIMYRGNSDVSEALSAAVLPSDATNTALTWSSTNASVATVSPSGVVSGKAVGMATITVSAQDGSGVDAKCDVEVRQYVTEIILDKTWIPLLVGEEASISVTSILPDNAYDKIYAWTSSDNAIASVDNSGKVLAKSRGTADIKAIANDGSGVFASCSVRVMQNPCPSGAVDLGLSVYWATNNIGENVESYGSWGDFFAWGETETKLYFDNYKFIHEGRYTKYYALDNKTVLDPEDDVAHVLLGGNWRMPTVDEWRELLEKCNCISSGQNGKTGMEVTGPNGNSIFLPAAGRRAGGGTDLRGSAGYYWSSSLRDWDSAWKMSFQLHPIYVEIIANGRGSSGAVRPISD